MNIRDISKETGFSIDTIRYYEKMELIENVERSESGYRIFSDEDLKRFLFIKKAKKIGFTLNDIRELLTLRIETDQPCEPVHELARGKLKIVEEKLNELTRIKKVLKELIDQCSPDKSTDSCPILRVLEN
ncbi:MAG: heavy metal-responsive transcriptional regulator [Calditrichaeota bacterium]|nr:MAG: heavy metal-responsive transcriptional regulator [Calditrichota bacterium]MBL1207205.1 heavy metal-responsive transcriptional regulator [Calditrichota bacterium]NOG47038.1 heavy metal-responsive transcriptional regulator [Calditrichota bacterium]